MNNQDKEAIIANLIGNGSIDEAIKTAAAQRGAATQSTRKLEPASGIPEMHVGRGQQFGNITWFPIWTNEPERPRGYKTTFAEGTVRLNEAATATVGQLVVENTGDEAVLLAEGTLLDGGYQHRALTATVFVPAKSQVTLPVVCVEAGRWGGERSQKFANRMAPARVRAAMRGMYKGSNGVVNQSRPNQSQVWANVDAYAENLAIQNPTRSFTELRKDFDRTRANVTSEVAVALAGQRGVLVAVAGKPLALELFDHPETLAERLQGILDGYLFDAYGQPADDTRFNEARRFVLRVESAGATEEVESGRKRNAPDKYVATEALNVDDQLLHVSSLNAQHELVLAA